MTLEELLKLKQEDYQLFIKTTQGLNEEIPKYLKYNQGKLNLISNVISPDHRIKNSQANQGRIFSEESKKKMSNSQKGKIKSEDSKRKIANAMKEIMDNQEIRNKISLSLKDKPKTEEHRKKMSKSHKGKSKSEDHKKNIAMAGKNRITKEETKQKISESIKNIKYAIYEGKEYSLTELGSLLNISKKILYRIKVGVTKNNYGIQFL